MTSKLFAIKNPLLMILVGFRTLVHLLSVSPFKRLRSGIALLFVVILFPSLSLAESARVALRWDAPTRNTDFSRARDIAAYKIYLGTRTGRYNQAISVGPITSYTLQGLAFDTTYYLSLSAVDTSGNESELVSEQRVRTISRPLADAPFVPVPTETDSDGDGLSNTFELAYGTRIDRADTDRDGVADLAELQAGSDPLDRGSVVDARVSSGCVRWTTALPNVWNIFEQISYSSTPQSVSSYGFETNGALFHKEQFSLGDFGRNDILAHERASRAASSEGNFCSSAYGASAAFEGRMVYYLPETNPSKFRQFQFALTESSSDGEIGPQIVAVNTFHPGAGPADGGKATANWLYVSNLEGRTEAGTLYIHDSSGALLRQERFELGAYEIRSLALHDLGSQWYGSVRWVPERAVTRFSISVSRFYYDNPWAYPSFDAAVQIQGKTATGQAQYIPVDTIGRSVVLELLNALDREVAAEVYIGSVRETVVLPAFGTVHLPLDSYVGASQTARVAVRSNAAESISATALYYARLEDGTLRYAYAMRAKEPLKPRLRGAYNTHISQSPWLSLVTDVAQEVTIVMRRTNGTKVTELRLPISDTLSVDLSSFEAADRTGTVFVLPDQPGSLAAWVLRVKPWEYVLPTEMN